MGLKIENGHVKCHFIIGNPPYQEETKDTSDMPLYHYYMDGVFSLADVVELISPARFLFNAGKTPKAWNEKMLSDPHFKVLEYEQDSSRYFSNADIKGGVAITYRDKKKKFGSIEVFSQFAELNGIRRKVTDRKDFSPLSEIIYQQNKFDLDALYADYPECKDLIGSNGNEKRLTTKIFEQLPIFSEKKKSESEIAIIGLIKNKRFYKYIDKKYLLPSENLDFYKVILPASTGSGAMGEILSNPFVAQPLTGYTQTFISIGKFETQHEAEAALKYVKSKFARTMLGILKVTQHNHKETWRMVPLQNFTSSSDIDWTKSVSEVDQQLYKKYGLDEKEIDFIESHVKEMD